MKRPLQVFGIILLALACVGAKKCDGSEPENRSASDEALTCGACPRQVPDSYAACLETGLNCYYPQPDRLFHCDSFGEWKPVELGSASEYSAYADTCPEDAPEPGTSCPGADTFDAVFEEVLCDSCADCISCTYFESAPSGCGGTFKTFTCDGGSWQEHPDDTTRPWLSDCESDDDGEGEIPPCIPQQVTKSCTCNYPADYVGTTSCWLGERSSGPAQIDADTTERTIVCTAPDVCRNPGGEWHIFSTCTIDGRETICCDDFSGVECVGVTIGEVVEPSGCCL